jgi:hypothetical protein
VGPADDAAAPDDAPDLSTSDAADLATADAAADAPKAVGE